MSSWGGAARAKGGGTRPSASASDLSCDNKSGLRGSTWTLKSVATTTRIRKTVATTNPLRKRSEHPEGVTTRGGRLGSSLPPRRDLHAVPPSTWAKFGGIGPQPSPELVARTPLGTSPSDFPARPWDFWVCSPLIVRVAGTLCNQPWVPIGRGGRGGLAPPRRIPFNLTR